MERSESTAVARQDKPRLHANPWIAAPQHVQLEHNHVHVWRAYLDSAPISSLEYVISPDEKARADKYHFQKDRERFIAARGILRSILSRYLPCKAYQIEFIYNAYGKPYLSKKFAEARLQFNVSHSRGVALFAVTRDREVGVDLEFSRSHIVTEQIAERFFSPAEVEALKGVSPDLQQVTFFTFWTRKEAVLKAMGEGLSRGLDQIDVSKPFDHNTTPEFSKWAIEDLAPGPGYVGALAFEGHTCQVCCYQWPDEGAKSSG